MLKKLQAHLFKRITERSKKIIIMKEQENIGGRERHISPTVKIGHLEEKNTSIEIKHSVVRLNSRLDTIEEIVSELENRFEEIISHNTAQREKYEQEEKKTWDIE